MPMIIAQKSPQSLVTTIRNLRMIFIVFVKHERDPNVISTINIGKIKKTKKK